MVRLFYRYLAAIGAISLFLIILCCHDYAWQGEIVDFIDKETSEVRIVEHRISINSTSFPHCIPEEINTVYLDVSNPAKLALAYGLTASEPALIGTVSVAQIDEKNVSLAFPVYRAAFGKTLTFRVSVTAGTRAFPDYLFSVPCHDPEGIGVDVSVSLPDVSARTLVFTPPSAIIAQNNAAFTMAAVPSLPVSPSAVWAWYVDGTVQAGYTISSFLFNATAFAVGAHILSATASDGTLQYSGSMMVTVSPYVTLPNYTVSYDTAGGNAVLPDAQYAEGATVFVSSDAGALSGYAFDQWHTDDINADGSVTVFDDTALPAQFTMPGNNVMLSADWVLDINHLPVTELALSVLDNTAGITWVDPVSPEFAYVIVDWYPNVDPASLLSRNVVRGAEGTAIEGLPVGTNYTIKVYAVYVD